MKNTPKRIATAWVSSLLLLSGCDKAPTPVLSTVVVQRADLVFASSFYGEVEARQSHPILAPDLRNTWQITVESVLADGTLVKKGDVVLTFAKGPMEEDLREKQSALAVAEAGYRKVAAQNQDDRITRTLTIRRDEMGVELAKLAVVEGVNFISKIDLEKAKVELARAELQLDVDRKEITTFEKKAAAALEVERLQVSTAADKVKEIQGQLVALQIKAPADGMLYAPYTRLNWNMGKVAPGKVARPGDKILEVPQLDRFNAAVYVRQRDAALVRVGDEASVVATMFPDQPFKGKVVSKDEFATTRNERMGTSTPQGTLKEVKVVLELEGGAEKLRPGGTVRADISTVLAKNVLLAPLAAVKEWKGERWVVLADGRKAPVQVGKTSTTHAEILNGAREGDQLRLE
ncbi:MAG: HlyD family efflux transporter periplasmic adaptor subunit [Myxococcota bacterium]|jgi:multidrug resistance efflux pump|nr:HlyD family efflux transporter periplasmic adaptor subunit [Myxococcota bacterium]